MIRVRATRFGILLSSNGLLWSLQFLMYRCFGGLVEALTRNRTRLAIRNVVERSPALANIFVIKSAHDYRFPYSQRSHHLARALASCGDLVFFISPGSGYDQIATIEQIACNLFITPHFRVTSELCRSAVLIVFSTDMSIDERFLKSWPGTIVYDYIDALDDTVSSAAVTPERLGLHQRLLKAQNSVVCLASADRLLEEVVTFRSKNFGLVENAVDTTHYQVQRDKAALQSRQRRVVEEGKLIAGYFGALAHWIDYDLLNSNCPRTAGRQFRSSRNRLRSVGSCPRRCA